MDSTGFVPTIAARYSQLRRRFTVALSIALCLSAACCLVFAQAGSATDTDDQKFDLNASGFSAFGLFSTFSSERVRLLGITRLANETLQPGQHLTYSNTGGFFGGDNPAAARVATDDNGRVTFAWIRGGSVQFRQRTPNGTLTAVRTVYAATEDTDASGLRIGTDGVGNVTLAWAELRFASDTDEQYTVMTRRIAPNGALGPAQDVSPVYHNDFTFGRRVIVDVNQADTAVFAWRHGVGTLSARLRDNSGTFSAEQTVTNQITNGGPSGSPFDISLDGSGNAYYAWIEGFPNDGNNGVTVKARTRRASTGAQTAVRTVATDAASFDGGFVAGGEIAIDSASGTSSIAYTRKPTGAVVTTAGLRTLTAAGVLGANRSVAAGSTQFPRYGLPDVSIAPDGGLALSFLRGTAPSSAAQVIGRAASSQTAALSGPVTVFDGTGVNDASLERRSAGHVLFRFEGFGPTSSGCMVRGLNPDGTLTAVQSYGNIC